MRSVEDEGQRRCCTSAIGQEESGDVDSATRSTAAKKEGRVCARCVLTTWLLQLKGRDAQDLLCASLQVDDNASGRAKATIRQ